VARTSAPPPIVPGSAPPPDTPATPLGSLQSDPAFLLVPTLVVGGSTCILSTSPLVAAGWVITLSDDSADSHFTIPGVAARIPLRRDGRGNYYVSFVPTHGGLTVSLGTAAEEGMVQHPFLLDSGAEISVVGMHKLSLLRELGCRPLPLLHTVSGPPVPVLETGYLMIVLPRGATPPPPRAAAARARQLPGPLEHGRGRPRPGRGAH
jgi:hypothetical protein